MRPAIAAEMPGFISSTLTKRRPSSGLPIDDIGFIDEPLREFQQMFVARTSSKTSTTRPVPSTICNCSIATARAVRLL